MLALGLSVQAGDRPDPDPGADRDGGPGPRAGPVPGRPAAVRVPAGRRRAAPEQGPRGLGPAGAPPGARPGDRAGRPVDVRPAAGRAQRRADHPGAERRRACPCPSAADPERNPHRTGAGWTLRHGRGDPGQPAVYRAAGVEPAAHRPRPGRPGQHRARAPAGAAVEPARGLGHLPPSRASGAGQRGRLHRRPGRHRAARPAPRACADRGRYLLAGLLACGTCGRRLESAWSNGKPAYRCRHGHTSAAGPDPDRPKNPYVREDQILPHLAALHLLLTEPAMGQRRRRTRRGIDVRRQATPEDVIGYLREHRSP